MILTFLGIMPATAQIAPTLLHDINAGPGDSATLHMHQFVYEHDGEVYFSALNKTEEVEFWKTDGSPGGTAMLADLDAPIGDAVEFAGDIFFLTGHLGQKLIRVEKASGEVSVLREYNSVHYNLVAGNDYIYFSCNIEGFAGGICRSDGTVTGTEEVHLSFLGVGDLSLTYYEGYLYFTGIYPEDPDTRRLLRIPDVSDPELESVKVLGVADDQPWTHGVVANGVILFRGPSEQIGDQLWRSDGTEEGTFTLGSMVFQGLHEMPIVVGDHAYFTARDSSFDNRNYVTDGSDAWLVYGGAQPYEPGTKLAYDDSTYIEVSTWNGWGESEIWMSDGTLIGSELLYSISDGTRGVNTTHLIDGFVVFELDGEGIGNSGEIWYLDREAPGAWIVGTTDAMNFSIPVGRDLFGFMDFDIAGVEPGVLEIGEHLGLIFRDTFD